MIYIDLDEIDFVPLLMEGFMDLEPSVSMGAKFAKIASKLYLGCDLTIYETQLMNGVRDYCIREAAKNEIRFR